MKMTKREQCMSEIVYTFPPCFTDAVACGDNITALRKWEAFLKMKARSNEQITNKQVDVHLAKGDNPHSSQKNDMEFGIHQEPFTQSDVIETTNSREDKQINHIMNHKLERHACTLEKKNRPITGMKNGMQDFENMLRH